VGRIDLLLVRILNHVQDRLALVALVTDLGFEAKHQRIHRESFLINLLLSKFNVLLPVLLRLVHAEF